VQQAPTSAVLEAIAKVEHVIAVRVI
jgi:hypothetical protein